MGAVEGWGGTRCGSPLAFARFSSGLVSIMVALCRARAGRTGWATVAFIFYDTETTGTDRCFDQILQFAAVMTDDDLNIVDRFEIRSRLLPHVVPSPAAMFVTRVRADQLHDPATPSHFEMCQRIHEQLSAWSPATILGYNSIRFDEELLRRAFYASLLPIYLTNSRGNTRADVLTLAMATHAFAPGALNWPVNEKGRVSFRLDRLAPANGFCHDNAHDALDDVLASLHLARLIRDRAPDVWAAVMDYRSKRAASAYVTAQPVFVASQLRFGVTSSHLVTALGVNPDHSGELFAFDLQHDPAPLASMSEDELAERLLAKPRPILSIRLNACPVFVPAHMYEPSCGEQRTDRALIDQRANRMRADPALRDRLITTLMTSRLSERQSCRTADL